MNSIEKLCRFCLKQVMGTRFENIEGKVRNMSSVLKLKMDLDISEEPVICVDCVENLQRLYSFKVICIETQNRLLSFMNSHSRKQVDLPQVYLKINENKILGEQNICIFCMCEIPNDLSIHLDTVLNTMASIKNLLESFLPEVDLTLVRDPVTCKMCHSFIQEYLAFTKNCENIEGAIKKYIDAVGPNSKGLVALRNVQQFLNRTVVVKQEIDHIGFCKHETEQNDDEVMEDLSLSLKLNSGSSFRTEGLELDIKRENVDVKPILNDTERAMNSTCLTVENIKNQEGDEFNEIKNAEHFWGPVSHNCNESNIKVEPREDINKDLCICENPFPAKESKKCKHKIKRKCYSQQDLPSENNALETKRSFKNNKFADKIALGDVTTYKCDKEGCLYETKHKRYLSKHKLIHKDLSEIKLYKCDSENCLYVTKYKSNLSKHKFIHKDVSELTTYKCGYNGCSFETNRKNNMSVHELVHKDLSEVTIYKCAEEDCSFETKRGDSFYNHKLVHKDLSQVTIYKCECEGCSFETKYKTALKNHKMIHMDQSEMPTFKCKYKSCSFETKRQDSLKKHQLVHMDASETRMYKCDAENCSYETKRKACLESHKLIHKDSSEIMMYKCSYDGCSFTTKYKQNMSKHKLIHKDLSEVTVYKCDNEDCSFETKHKKSLKGHRLIHRDSSEVAIYKCKTGNCSFETRFKRSMVNHEYIHKNTSGITIYKCKCEGCSSETK